MPPSCDQSSLMKLHCSVQASLSKWIHRNKVSHNPAYQHEIFINSIIFHHLMKVFQFRSSSTKCGMWSSWGQKTLQVINMYLWCRWSYLKACHMFQRLLAGVQLETRKNWATSRISQDYIWRRWIQLLTLLVLCMTFRKSTKAPRISCTENRTFLASKGSNNLYLRN